MSSDDTRRALPVLDSPTSDRREAVKRIGGWLIFAGVLGTGALEGCGPHHGSRRGDGPPAVTPTGLKAGDVPVNGVAWSPDASLFICHATDGFYAMDSVCTHRGCDIGERGGFSASNLGFGFGCACHGSTFDANGNRTGGPAREGLLHHPLAIEPSGEILVDRGHALPPMLAFVHVSAPIESGRTPAECPLLQNWPDRKRPASATDPD
jgi:Rieske Fe-S protein